MHILMPVIWASLIAFSIIMYVILDGFTLGTGMLLPWLESEQRDIVLSIILPTWDGNQTWLVLGLASLYGAFPLAFSIILPKLYIPLLFMVIALLFRGVVFEFRLKSTQKARQNWDRYFIASCYLATFIQGLILGAFVQGFTPKYNFKWLSAFSLLTAFALIFGYMLLGSTRLILKTVGNIQHKMYIKASQLCWYIAFFLSVVSLFTPFVNQHVFTRWFIKQEYYFLFIIPFITFLAWWGLFTALKKKNEISPYWLSVLLFICGYIGFAIDIWPYIVPYEVSIWQGAAPLSTLHFMLYGATIMLPVLLAYTGYAYKIFSGKVTHVIHY